MDVRESEDGLTITVKTDKRLKEFEIYKGNDGYSMFKIKYVGDNSRVPEELAGNYTTRQMALNALKVWDLKAKPTNDAKWEQKYKDHETPVLKVKPNATKVLPKGN